MVTSTEDGPPGWVRLRELLGLVAEAKERSMPRVLISVREVVTYSREIEMSEADWRQWDEKTELRGKAHDKAVEELAAHFIRRDEDWQDATDLELMELSLVLED